MRKSILRQLPRFNWRKRVAAHAGLSNARGPGPLGTPVALALLGLLGASAVTLHAGALGTVFSATNQHMNTRGAAETAVTALGPNGTLSMSFNGDDPSGLIVYSNNTRTVKNGASTTAAATYDWNTNMVTSRATMRPPSGWAVLWGDTSITRNKADTNWVYVAGLGVPSSKFPQGGIVGSFENSNVECAAYLGGGCVTRSNNNGITWSTAASDCLQHTTTSCPHGDFYDGSDMTTSPEGRVYVAFNDVSRARIDVWMATSLNGSFALLPEIPIASDLHPRLRYGPDGLYLLFQIYNDLILARYNGGSSYSGTWSWITVPGSAGVFGAYQRDIKMSDRAIRLGPQYDFDIGFSETGTDEIRIVFALLNSSKKHYIKAVRCTTGAMTCTQPSVWSTAATSGDQWGPAIAFGFNPFTGKPSWELSYYSRQNAPTGNTVELWAADIATSIMTNFKLENAQVACPDLRKASDPVGFGSYWGDYDRMGGSIGTMWRGFTDSSHGTCSRQMFHSSPNYAALSAWTVL